MPEIGIPKMKDSPQAIPAFDKNTNTHTMRTQGALAQARDRRSRRRRETKENRKSAQSQDWRTKKDLLEREKQHGSLPIKIPRFPARACGELMSET
eukprot:2629309-Rhodomonas_salina.2